MSEPTPDLEPVDAGPMVGLPQAIADLAARMPVRSAEEIRAWDFENVIKPRLVAWGFERRYRNELAAWNCEEQEATYRVCLQTLTGVGAIVALIGLRGAGKTTIAAQLAIERAWREQAARQTVPGTLYSFSYTKLTTLVQRFKPLYAGFGSIDPEALRLQLAKVCRERDVLVIDEFHDLSELAVREALLIDLIDRRYAAQKDTLLISNQTPEEWEKQTPTSIQDRINEHGRVLICDWHSWRSRKDNA